MSFSLAKQPSREKRAIFHIWRRETGDSARVLAEKNESRLSFLQNFALIKLLRLQLRPELKIIIYVVVN
jgi:hypothetical protein